MCNELEPDDLTTVRAIFNLAAFCVLVLVLWLAVRS
jgi:hypothetical protein